LEHIRNVWWEQFVEAVREEILQEKKSNPEAD
jgi:hypothetical protein